MSAQPVNEDAVHALRAWLSAHHSIFVLSGAGVSTRSGIPDYRGEDGEWKRRAPVMFQPFLQDSAVRARYWARSFVGWPVVGRARPNRAHDALAALEAQGKLSTLVTQNVDGLHQRAAQQRVIDLHGRIDQVICLGCGIRHPRDSVQSMLANANPEWLEITASTAPDGDADLEQVDFSAFREPVCPHCRGMLKPDVVFFGENVPRERVRAATEALHRSDAMLVVGSSLMVYSGFRFAQMAHGAGVELAILTLGRTRADHLTTLKLHADCEILADSLPLVASLPAATAGLQSGVEIARR